MKKQALVKRLLNNWPAKLICFVLAVLIYAFYQVTSLERKSISVKLNVSSNGSVVAASSVPDYVRVTVRGNSEDILHITEDNISALLDLNFYSNLGEVDIPVLLELDESVTAINPLEVTVSPEYIKVTLETKASTLVPVSPVVQGNPARGYEVASYSIMPSSVRITGPQSLVNTVTELSSNIVSIDQATASVSKTVSIFNTNNYITVDNPAETTITVEIQPIQIERTFQNIPVFLTAIPEGLVIEANKKLSVTIQGPMLEIEKYEFGDYTVRADCSRITSEGEYTVPLSFYTPNTFKIVSRTFESLPVSATLKVSEEINDITNPTVVENNMVEQ